MEKRQVKAQKRAEKKIAKAEAEMQPDARSGGILPAQAPSTPETVTDNHEI